MRAVEGPRHRLAVVVAGAVAVTLPLAAPAQADPSDDAVNALKSAPVYAGADAPKLDKSRLGADALGDVKVAILPTGGPNPVSVAQSMANAAVGATVAAEVPGATAAAAGDGLGVHPSLIRRGTGN